jgi:C4-dicarboxylate-specific signal transduction histidine kinase
MTGATVVRLILHDEDSGWHLSTMAHEVAQSLSVEEAGARNLLPLSAFRYMQRTLKPLVVDDVMRDDRFSRDPYFSGLVHCSLLAVPILAQGAPRAVLLLENRLSHGAFAADRLDAVMLIAGQLAVSLDNALVYASLEHKVAERTAELETIHKQLLKLSRQAGMAEIAANVLHNVGNVLNSANVSITLVCDSIKRSKLASLEKLVALLSEHQGDLPTFLRSDPRGKHVPAYLPELLKWLRTEQAEHMKELNSLRQNIEHIKEIVSTQQAFAKPLAVKQQVEVTSLMDEALRMGLGAPDGSPLRIVRQFQELPPMNIDRHKILQILINLVSNAKHACMESDRDDMRLTLQTSRTANVLRLSVADNGVGIAAENLVRIFSHGFTTKLTGHGFGLHSSALAAKEMGGSLQVHSDGPGCGATFTVELPVG